MTSCDRSEWTPFRPDAAVVASLAAGLGVSQVTAQVLAARGIVSVDQARAFLSPSLTRDWPDTAAIPGLAQAAARVAAAVRVGERIVVFGDFDLDGISAAATATLGLRALGADVTATVPHRFREGYGLTPAANERLVAMHPDLVVTVDCGISGGQEVAWLRARGIDVVVTDHHEAGECMPEGVPVADPKLSPDGPELAGAGVALALIRAVGELVGQRELWRTLTDLAMLGTVSDVVPLTGANRALVADGLARAREGRRVGITALATVASIEVGALSADKISFGLAPRLNAAGRMADPGIALELLMTEDAAEADELARALDEHNRLRQAAESDLMDAALAEAEQSFAPGDRLLIVAGDGWHEGVRGIVASRLVGRFGVPAVVIGLEDGIAQGSGRSVPGVDLFQALSPVSERLIRFGGHAAAIGLTLAADRLPEVRSALIDALASVPSDAFISRFDIDAVVPLDGISRELVAELARLEPFGFANPRPVLAAHGVFLNGRRAVGKTGQHLRFTAYDGVAAVPGVMFRCPDTASLVSTESAVDIAFELEVDAWRGQERLQLLARDIRPHAIPEAAPAADLVEDLFGHADEILAREEYAGIGEADAFHTKLAGVTFEGRQSVLEELSPGTPLRIERQPDNEFDPNACALFEPSGRQAGYFNRRLAAVLAPLIDADVEYDVSVTEVTGGVDGAALGVNVLVSRHDAVESDAELAEASRERRRSLAALDPASLDAALVTQFIGDRPLHRAQTDALELLVAGTNTLVVMATGRGKSLIFHVHAARRAIAEGVASVFVYPLRALVADQSFHLQETMSEIGVIVRTLTGESAPGARDEVFEQLSAGEVDIVLTTPEFLEHHAQRFAESARVRFVVIDEAHHIGRSGANHRPAYRRLAAALATLGDPEVVAVTATADTDTAVAIGEVLGITETVLDPTVRDNLRVEDRRAAADKAAIAAGLAAQGDKVIVYVNARETSIELAKTLRARVPGLTHAVAFYNGGMTRASRHAVERAFRDGTLRAIVATSAFGEGVNIPDIRHVVLYHMPFGAVEFNQMCGRAGRDGEPAHVHLLFGQRDARINRVILESSAPPRDELAALYVALRDCAGATAEPIEVSNAELAERVKARLPRSRMTERGVSAGLGVFRELSLVSGEGAGSYRRLRLLPAPETKLDLAASVRYAEGLQEQSEFEAFCMWVMDATPEELLHTFNRPILPEQPPGADPVGA